MTQEKRIYRSRKDRVLGGVCGGIAEYMELDPVIVRLLTVVGIFFSGVGFIFYLFAWLIIPNNPRHTVVESVKAAINEVNPKPKNNALPFALGVVLVIFGILLVADELGWVRHLSFSFNLFPWRLFWPMVFIFFGIFLLVSNTSIASKADDVKQWAKDNRLSKSRTDKHLFGVCGGLAKQFEIDSTIIRLLFAVGAFISFGFGVLLYIVLAVILPEENLQAAKESAKDQQKS